LGASSIQNLDYAETFLEIAGALPLMPAPGHSIQRKLATECGGAKYRKKRALVEPEFRRVKGMRGFRAMSRRGLRQLAGDRSLVCTALDLRRMCGRELQL
jgi:hypothetical protein